jgi:uncharacterized protein with GYD domain
VGFPEASEEEDMPYYVSLITWTDQGRENAATLPDRVEQVEKRVNAAGAKTIANWMTMGRYDQVWIGEAPDDETVVKLLMVIAGRGNAVTETMRAFSMDEVRDLLKGADQLTR